jgi:hypothetical protein
LDFATAFVVIVHFSFDTLVSYFIVGGAGVPRRWPALDLWRRIHQSDRDAVLPLQGPLVLPLRLETLGEGEFEHSNTARKNLKEEKSVNGLIIGGGYSGNTVFEEQQTPVLSK